jgi:hypothetical protein
MKLISVKKVKRLYYYISVSLTDMVYKKDYQMRKIAYITFLGIPLIPKKSIYITPNKQELIGLE